MNDTTALWQKHDAFDSNTHTVVGIDLGTTNCCVALWSRTEDAVKIIDIHKHRTTPSVLRYQDVSDTPLVGHEAQMDAHLTPRSVLSNVKRFIGKTYDDTQEEALRYAFDVVPLDASVDSSALNPKQDVSKLLLHFQHKGTTCELLPEEASAIYLRYLRVGVDEWLSDPDNTSVVSNTKNHKTTAAVITVPARFGYLQRLATKRAASRAGFQQVRLIAEPTAAAMAYGVGVAGTKRVLVYDLGGGTFDVSILDVNEGNFKVVAMGGNERLGGNDIDDLILRHVLQTICSKLHLQIPKPTSRKQTRQSCPRDIQTLCNILKLDMSSSTVTSLRQACEKAKIQASDFDAIESGQVNIDVVLPITECSKLWEGFQESIILEINTLDNIVRPVIEETLISLRDVVKRAQVKESIQGAVNEVILVGGPTRMPCLRSAIQQEFPGVVLCKDINPDEVVAEGAAIQAAVLSGVNHNILKEILLMDVLPMSIGVSSGNGTFVPIVPRNTNIPCTRSKTFFTAVDNQRGITVELYEGEAEQASDNQFLTRFNFPIPKTRRGLSGRSVTVTFAIGAGGMIRVTTDADEENKEEETKHQMLLLFFVFVLMAMLFFLRMNPAMFRDKISEFERQRKLVDGVGSGVAEFDEFEFSPKGNL